METVTNIASAASRAIWGDSTTAQQTAAGTEPVSGKTGNVEAGQPYDKGNDDVNTTSTSDSKDTTLPTQDNYQKDTTTTSTGTTIPTPETNTTAATTGTASKLDTATPAATTGTTSKVDTATPSTNTTDNSITSKMSDNLPSTSLDKTSSTSTNNNTSTSGPPTDSVTPAAGSSTTPKDQTTTDNTNTSSTNNEPKDTEETKEATSAELKAAGIEETKKEGDHAPKYDTFKTADGPHIGDGKNDGRVGPEIEKGDLKEFEEKEESKKDVGEAKVDSATSGSGSAAGSEHASSVKKDHHAAESGDSVDSAGKEKVSLKDKIKAKLHKH